MCPMENFNGFLDLPSPSSSLPYQLYLDSESYLASPTNTSASTSPLEASFDMLPYGTYPSPDQTDGSGEIHSSEESSNTKPATKRKRENRYKNAPPSVLSRRRAQNRASQRAYRERKDQRIKDLEGLLAEAHQKNDVLSQAFSSLQAEYVKIRTQQETAAQDLASYQQASMGFEPMIGPGNGTSMDQLFMYNDAAGFPM